MGLLLSGHDKQGEVVQGCLTMFSHVLSKVWVLLAKLREVGLTQKVQAHSLHTSLYNSDLAK